MSQTIVLIAAGVALLMLVRIAWLDFLTLKIRNTDVLVLSGVTLLMVALTLPSPGLVDLAAGALLFVLGVVFWSLGMTGAGDAKLLFPLGIMVGFDGLATFALLLMPVSLLVLVLFIAARLILPEDGRLRRRLAEIKATKGIPYAVPLFLAAFGAMLPRFI
jgi:prepilin peptidase CpaA